MGPLTRFMRSEIEALLKRLAGMQVVIPAFLNVEMQACMMTKGIAFRVQQRRDVLSHFRPSRSPPPTSTPKT
jgi:hypothetical protein